MFENIKHISFTHGFTHKYQKSHSILFCFYKPTQVFL